jgi:YegS/Rv2252/BmrU family lipid kinase
MRYALWVMRAAIVLNPYARNAPSWQRLLSAVAVERLRGWEIEVMESRAPMHAIGLAREAARKGARVVFACGGDGTVNEVINGILGTGAALGVLRAGTGNVFGKEVRVPRKLESALSVLDEGRLYQFDLGYAEGPAVAFAPPDAPGPAPADARRYFLLMAGIGFDGAVVRRVPRAPKRVLGTASYVIWGAAEALRFKGTRVSLKLDGQRQEMEVYWTLLGNTRSYGGVADVALQAVADDGLLDAYLFSGKGLPFLISTGARIAFRRHQNAPSVTYARVASLEIETPGLHVQADGEYFGETPIRFGVERRVLEVLLMPGAADRILTGQAGEPVVPQEA